MVKLYLNLVLWCVLLVLTPAVILMSVVVGVVIELIDLIKAVPFGLSLWFNDALKNIRDIWYFIQLERDK